MARVVNCETLFVNERGRRRCTESFALMSVTLALRLPALRTCQVALLARTRWPPACVRFLNFFSVAARCKPSSTHFKHEATLIIFCCCRPAAPLLPGQANTEYFVYRRPHRFITTKANYACSLTRAGALNSGWTFIILLGRPRQQASARLLLLLYPR